ncbi:MAG: fumarylacetoacetate hydrolase family protein [Anaerolineae bacterium]|nr:fumarylacetoacetate hydrolase family protein [Anaerolineae bacterium]
MQLCRFHLPNLGSRIGLLLDSSVIDLTAGDVPYVSSLAALLRASTERSVISLVSEIETVDLPRYSYSALEQTPSADTPHLLPPVDRQEIWAAGVTYAWSREARVQEAQSKEIYVRVYDAERPEIFFKSLPEKAVGPGDFIGVRGDSNWNVPEPELALVLNPHMDIVGYTIGNDVSSRDIEGENPLYLPQAKVYDHSCALGPVITIADETMTGQDLGIKLLIERDGTPVFEGETRTSEMHRPLSELADFLGRYNSLPHGAVLLTGTCIVPSNDFTLQDGDIVSIEIESVGTLRNYVRCLVLQGSSRLLCP